MYNKIVHFVDEKNFGSEVIVYKSNKNYFVITIEFGIKSYNFLDLNLNNMYPINSYIEKIGFKYEENIENDNLDYEFDVDLQKYFCIPIPEWLKKLI